MSGCDDRMYEASAARCSVRRWKSLLSEASRCSASDREIFSERRSSCRRISSCSIPRFSSSALRFTSCRYSTLARSLSWIWASVSRIHSLLLCASRSFTSSDLRYSSALRSACSASRLSSSTTLLLSSIVLMRPSESTFCCTNCSLTPPRSCLCFMIDDSAMRSAERSHSFSSWRTFTGSCWATRSCGCGGGFCLNISWLHVVPSI
mmetsp:Transcript_40457/g.99359  ORF Transcript_40457/g.99359 Transcript_40457/m.99359 type:complete len:206 (-) Transcript_40457:100-717(-)